MRIGLAMSGGGVRGLAHVGLIKALRENEIHIHEFSGVSAGALVGVMAAADCSIDDMLDFWLNTDPFSIRHLVFGEPALFSTTDYMESLRRFVPQERFEELPHPLFVGVTAMLSGDFRILSEGPLWPLILGSAAFPIVFSPVECDDEIFSDGGLVENFIPEPLRDSCDIVIGSDVDPLMPVDREDLKSIRGMLERVMTLQGNGQMHEKGKMCDVLVVPSGIDEYGTFQTKAMREIFELGYETGKQMIPQVKALLESSSDSSK